MSNLTLVAKELTGFLSDAKPAKKPKQSEGSVDDAYAFQYRECKLM